VAANAAEVLGMPELAGCFVSPKGLTKKMTGAAAAGMVAGVAGTATIGKEGAPSFGTLGYVAVTATEVAIVKGKAGLLKPSVGSEVIARVSREQIASVELQPGALKAALKIGFAGGGGWEFEIPKVHRKNAERVAHVLASAG